MRGSIKWQTAQLAKAIFEAKVSKEERTDPDSERYGKISSYKTMKTYRDVWNDLGKFAKQELGVKDFEDMKGSHVAAFMKAKIDQGASRQHMEKITSAMGALERALERFSEDKHGTAREYDFSQRLEVLHEAKAENTLRDGYHDRAYLDPHGVISAIKEEDHRLAAQMQLEGGARLGGVSRIEPEQLRGLGEDPFTGREVGVFYTTEKGGKGGEVRVTPETYGRLREHIHTQGNFSIDERAYQRDVREAAVKVGEDPEGTHGFRWNFAQERMEELVEKGRLDYEQARQEVSWEMKHERASITDHYLYLLGR
jgi:integrase